MRPPSTAMIENVGSQCCPWKSRWSGKVIHMSFWSSRKFLGSSFQETSRWGGTARACSKAPESEEDSLKGREVSSGADHGSGGEKEGEGGGIWRSSVGEEFCTSVTCLKIEDSCA